MPIPSRRAAAALDLWTWFPYRWALSYLPPGAELWGGRLLGRVTAGMLPEALERCAANVRRGLPDHPDVLGVARQSLASRFLDRTASLCVPRMAAGGLDRYLSFSGVEHLEGSRERGRGIILAHPCMGPVRMAAMGLGLLGHPVVRLGMPDDEVEADSSPLGRRAEAVRRDLEARAPGTVLDGRGYLRPLLRKLSQGEIVALSYDGTPLSAGEQIGRRVELEMLGHQVRFPVGPVYLSLRSGAALHPMVVRSRPGGAGFDVRVDAEMPVEHREDIRETLRHNAQRLATHLERHLKEEPGGWHFWSEFEPGKFLL